MIGDIIKVLMCLALLVFIVVALILGLYFDWHNNHPEATYWMVSAILSLSLYNKWIRED